MRIFQWVKTSIMQSFRRGITLCTNSSDFNSKPLIACIQCNSLIVNHKFPTLTSGFLTFAGNIGKE